MVHKHAISLQLNYYFLETQQRTLAEVTDFFLLKQQSAIHPNWVTLWKFQYQSLFIVFTLQF